MVFVLKEKNKYTKTCLKLNSFAFGAVALDIYSGHRSNLYYYSRIFLKNRIGNILHQFLRCRFE